MSKYRETYSFRKTGIYTVKSQRRITGHWWGRKTILSPLTVPYQADLGARRCYMARSETQRPRSFVHHRPELKIGGGAASPKPQEKFRSDTDGNHVGDSIGTAMRNGNLHLANAHLRCDLTGHAMDFEFGFATHQIGHFHVGPFDAARPPGA